MRGGRILVVIGVIVLLGAALVGGYALVLRPRTQPKPTPPPTAEEGGPVVHVPQPEETGRQTIVVAAQNIPRGTRITEDNNAVTTAAWPEDAVPPGALADLQRAYGRIARVDIVLGMPVTDGMLTDRAGDLVSLGSDAALMVPPGRVAYALPVARWSSVAWAIEPGDHVDVLVSLLIVDIDEEFQTILPNTATTRDEEGVKDTGIIGRIEVLANGQVANIHPTEPQQRPRLVTQLTVQDAIVLRVGDWGEEEAAAPSPAEEEPTGEEEEEATPPPPPPPIKSLTVAVTPQDAAVLKYAEETGASMDLVLRSAADAGKALVTEQVTLDYVFARFAMEVPPKLPYGTSEPIRGLRGGTVGEVQSAPEASDRIEE